MKRLNEQENKTSLRGWIVQRPFYLCQCFQQILTTFGRYVQLKATNSVWSSGAAVLKCLGLSCSVVEHKKHMLKKQYAKNKPICKVTFYAKPSSPAQQVALVGDFNEWDGRSHLMEPLKDGRYKITLELDTDREYQFRYLVDSREWLNDAEADGYTPNPFNSHNSVVRTVH